MVFIRRTWCMRRGAVESSVLAQARWQVFHLGTPCALLGTQSKNELLTISEKRVVNPVLGVWLAVECGVLDVDVLVRRVKVDIANLSRLAGDGALNLNALKVRRSDEVDILARVGEESHHAHGDESTHGTAVVVARKTSRSRAEELGNVKVAAFSRQSRATRVMILEHGKESRLVANVRNALVVKVVQAAVESGRSTVQSNQLSLVMWNEATGC